MKVQADGSLFEADAYRDRVVEADGADSSASRSKNEEWIITAGRNIKLLSGGMGRVWSVQHPVVCGRSLNALDYFAHLVVLLIRRWVIGPQVISRFMFRPALGSSRGGRRRG